MRRSSTRSATAGRRAHRGRCMLEGRDTIGFEVASYDRTRPLVIDPGLVYSTYLGGSGAVQGTRSQWTVRVAPM